MEGLSNREIARNLDLSEHTIKNYLFRIFDKLGVSSRTELLLYAQNFMTVDVAPKGPSSAAAMGLGSDNVVPGTANSADGRVCA